MAKQTKQTKIVPAHNARVRGLKPHWASAVLGQSSRDHLLAQHSHQQRMAVIRSITGIAALLIVGVLLMVAHVGAF